MFLEYRKCQRVHLNMWHFLAKCRPPRALLYVIFYVILFERTIKTKGTLLYCTACSYRRYRICEGFLEISCFEWRMVVHERLAIDVHVEGEDVEEVDVMSQPLRFWLLWDDLLRELATRHLCRILINKLHFYNI